MRPRLSPDFTVYSVHLLFTRWGVEMPVQADDRNSGMVLTLGQRVTVRTTGVDWRRASVMAELIGVG